MSIYRFIALLFILTLFFSLLIKPDIVLFQSDKNVTFVEFDNFKLYNITNSGIIEYIEGENAKKMRDFDIISNLFLLKKEDSFIYKIIATKATLKNDIYQFSNSHIKRSDGLNIISEHILYDSLQKIVKSDKNFIIEFYNNSIVGTNLEYFLQTNVIKANNIKANLEDIEGVK
ncbi:MAG: hypothetical protein HXX81_02160 [Campylobacterales bacterium]|nr:hypothetical protein [Campylobacterales bacterium]